jgi:hypothetical protein
VCAATILAVLLAEVALRLGGVSNVVFDAYDDERGIALQPGTSGWYDKEGRAWVEINSFGYRDEEHPLAKPPGVFRVAVLGDSFTEARQVALEDTFLSVAERISNEGRDTGPAIEFLSFGVGGYGTGQELITLRRHALSFDPDLVLLAFTVGNDISDNSRRLSRDPFRPFFALQGGELVVDASFREWNRTTLRRRLLLWGVHHSKILELVNAARRAQWAAEEREQATAADADAALGEGEEVGVFSPTYGPPPDETWEQAWLVTEALLARIHAEAEAAGVRFALVTLTNSVHVHPDPEQRAHFARSLEVDDLYYPERRLSALGARAGFEVITLAEPLLERVQAAPEPLWLHGFENTRLGKGHWNENGHRMAGEVLAQELTRRGLLPAR